MRPSPEEISLRLFGPAGAPPALQPARLIPPTLIPWVRTVFGDRPNAWVQVWGAQATTRSLERLGVVERVRLPAGYERVRLTELAQEALAR